MIDYSRLPPHLKAPKPLWPWSPEDYDALSAAADRGDKSVFKHLGAWWRGPREEFSPSQLEKFGGGCQRAWAFRYILGIKEEQSDAARNGDIAHKLIHDYYDGFPLPLQSPDANLRRIAERVLPMIEHLPRLDQCSEIFRELPMWFDSTLVAPELEPLKILVKKDLEIRYGPSTWIVYDYKTVKKWQYMLGDGVPNGEKPALQEHPQGILYLLDTMQRRGVDVALGRWVYGMMDPEARPASRHLSVVVSRADFAPKGRRLALVANEMREHIRARVDPNVLPPKPSECMKFYSKTKGTGGCGFRADIGGPCNFGTCNQTTNYGALIMQQQTLTDMLATRPAPPAAPTITPTAAVIPGATLPNGTATPGAFVMPPLPAGAPFASPEAFAQQQPAQPQPGPYPATYPSTPVTQAVGLTPPAPLTALTPEQAAANGLAPMPEGWAWLWDGRGFVQGQWTGQQWNPVPSHAGSPAPVTAPAPGYPAVAVPAPAAAAPASPPAATVAPIPEGWTRDAAGNPVPPAAPAAATPAEAPAPKQKRKRRTQAELAAARAVGAPAGETDGETDGDGPRVVISVSYRSRSFTIELDDDAQAEQIAKFALDKFCASAA